MKVMVFVYAILVFIQFKTTNIKNTYSFTPAEIDQQIRRMNYYPPSQARLGYILENKKEVKFVEKFIGNFIKVVDFNTYFPDNFPIVTLPFFFVGLYLFIKENLEKKRRLKLLLIIYCLFFTVSFLSFLGIHGKYGPFLIFPFIGLFIYIGLIEVLHYVISHLGNWDFFRN